MLRKEKSIRVLCTFFFLSRLHFPPDQWVFFWGIPSIAVLQLHHGDEGGNGQSNPDCWYYSSLPIRDKVTPRWSQSLPEASFAFQQTAKPCQANLIYVSMGSLHHILHLKQDPKKTLHFLCCFFSSWWSEKFPELSVKLLTSNLFNKLLIYFQVCLAIVLSPFSSFNILLLFKMSLLSCVDFQWLKFPYFLFLLDIS